MFASIFLKLIRNIQQSVFRQSFLLIPSSKREFHLRSKILLPTSFYQILKFVVHSSVIYTTLSQFGLLQLTQRNHFIFQHTRCGSRSKQVRTVCPFCIQWICFKPVISNCEHSYIFLYVGFSDFLKQIDFILRDKHLSNLQFKPTIS